MAVGGLLVRKMWRRFQKKKGAKWWLAVNLRFRLGYYRDLFAWIAEGPTADGPTRTHPEGQPEGQP